MKKAYLSFILIIVFFLAGCGKAKGPASESSITFHRDGTVNSVVVEDFDESFYQVQEMKQMIEREIVLYNEKHQDGKVTLVSCEAADGKACVELQFKRGADYAAFNRAELFFGTVEEAILEGYCVNIKLKNVLGDNIIHSDHLSDFSDYHMIVLKDHAMLHTYDSILYTSANVELNDDKSAYLSGDSTGYGYLMIK